MRIIKFRFFKNGKLLGTAELNKKNQIVDTPYEWDEVSQFTGLLDKSGKEIWEGDIVKHEEKNICEVIYGRGCFFLCDRDENKNRDSMPNPYGPIKLEVLGNIYENPKLLKTK